MLKKTRLLNRRSRQRGTLTFQRFENRLMLSGTPNTADPNDEICETDLTLLDGQTLPGTISPITDVDLYAIEIPSSRVGREITFNVNETDGSFDTYLRLFDDTGNELDDDEDGGPGNNSQIDFTFSTAGTYYLGVSTSGNQNYDPNDGSGLSTDGFSSTGTYEVTFQDTNDQISEASNGLLDGVSSGTIDLPSDVDVFQFDAVEDQTFRFDLTSNDGLDTYIRIFDDGGTLLDSDDDGGTGTNSSLTFTFPDSDDFYVVVSSFQNRNYDVEDGTGDLTTATDTGSYSITATEVSTDPDDRISNAIDLGSLFDDGSVEGADSARFDGEISNKFDVDLYKFEVGRDGSFVEIDVDLPVSVFSLSPTLRLFDDSGTLIEQNFQTSAPGEGGLLTEDAFIDRTLAAGVYYAGVSFGNNKTYNITTGLGDSDDGSIFAIRSTGSYSIEIQDRLHVDTTDDGLAGGTLADNDSINTLREAIEFANGRAGEQTITFQPSVFGSGQTITLSVAGANQLEITDDLVINGSGADLLGISGNDNSRVFLIDDGDNNSEIDVTIRGLTIRDGNTSATNARFSESGAGIRNSEDLTLENVTVHSNRSDPFDGAFITDTGSSGGGLFHERGELEIIGSTFSENSGLNGGGIQVDSGSANIVNSTFSGNLARGVGGGGLNVSGSSTSATVRSSTFTGNRADTNGASAASGGGIAESSSAIITLHNNLIAGNFSGTALAIDDTRGVFTASSSHNLIGSSDAASSLNNGTNGNIVGDGNGGEFPVGSILREEISILSGISQFFLIPGSRAINAGSNAEAIDADGNALTTDQDGSQRIQLGTVDIGSQESPFETPSLIVNTNSDASTTSDGLTSLREAVLFANMNPGDDTIAFDAGLSGQTITLGSGQLELTESLTIQGLGADQLTISANDASRIFLLGSSAAATYTIADVTLTDGEVARGSEPSPETGGAISLNDADDTLIIERSVISSSAANGGGAIFVGGASELQVVDSALIDNEANFSGSAILTGGNVDVTIVNTTVSGNTSLSNAGALLVQTAGTESGTMTLRNVTVADNTGIGLQTFASGTSTATLSVGNTILADNSGSNLLTGGSGTAVFNSLGSNLFDDFSVTAADASDQLNVDPLLAPLANNGGPTPTHALMTGSLAINKGNNAFAVNANGNPLTTDQRGVGFDRIFSGTVDIGAFESDIQQTFLLGDVNQDGVVDFADIPSFISILQNGIFLDEADTNDDGVVDFFDIASFIQILMMQ